jgi:hypothetical protein
VTVDPTQPVKTEAGQTKPTGGGDRILIALLIGALAVTAVVVLLNVVGSDGVAVVSASPSLADSTPPSADPSTSSEIPATALPAPSPPSESPVFVTPEPGFSLEPVPTPDPGANPWGVEADHLRGQDGTAQTFECPAGGPPAYADLEINPWAVWGSNPYTDDSSVCRAGVHAGVITVDEGGQVTIRILPGMSWYPGSEANGIRSITWPQGWYGSYEVLLP